MSGRLLKLYGMMSDVCSMAFRLHFQKILTLLLYCRALYSAILAMYLQYHASKKTAIGVKILFAFAKTEVR